MASHGGYPRVFGRVSVAASKLSRGQLARLSWSRRSSSHPRAMVDMGKWCARATSCKSANLFGQPEVEHPARAVRSADLRARRVWVRGISFDFESTGIFSCRAHGLLTKLLHRPSPPSGQWSGRAHWQATRSCPAARRRGLGRRSRPALALPRASSPGTPRLAPARTASANRRESRAGPSRPSELAADGVAPRLLRSCSVRAQQPNHTCRARTARTAAAPVHKG